MHTNSEPRRNYGLTLGALAFVILVTMGLCPNAHAAGNFAFAVKAEPGLDLVFMGYAADGSQIFEKRTDEMRPYNGSDHYIVTVDEEILQRQPVTEWCVRDLTERWTLLPVDDGSAILCDDSPSESRGTYTFVYRTTNGDDASPQAAEAEPSARAAESSEERYPAGFRKTYGSWTVQIEDGSDGKDCVVGTWAIEYARVTSDRSKPALLVINFPRDPDTVIIQVGTKINTRRLHYIVVDDIAYQLLAIRDGAVLVAHARDDQSDRVPAELTKLANRAIVRHMLHANSLSTQFMDEAENVFADQYDLDGFVQAKEVADQACSRD